MRLRSIHPKYLDQKWLVAVRREWLLAKKVLENQTKGYKNHPQLIRFRNHKNPVAAINSYLIEIHKESEKRKYSFDKSKLKMSDLQNKIPVTKWQIEYEFQHLSNKLKSRDLETYNKISRIKNIDINPIFYTISGEIEHREKIYTEPPIK